MMKQLTTLSSLLFSTAIIIYSCQSMEQRRENQDQDSTKMMTEKHSETVLTDIPFAIAQNYFVQNDAQLPEDPKITAQSDFDSIFGNATLMGEDGKSTPIDFEQQFVIAVVLDQSDFATKIEPMDLRKLDSEKIQFRYTVTVGERQPYISQSALILVVDKKHEATVVLKRED